MKTNGLLIRGSWVRIPPGSFNGIFAEDLQTLVRGSSLFEVRDYISGLYLFKEV